MPDLFKRLSAFQKQDNATGTGPLCVTLVVTEHARKNRLPLNADTLITAERGQVLGLGKSAVQAVLKRHGIEKVLAEEGGRTSRGSIGHMRRYVEFLNQLHADKLDHLDQIEAWSIEKVREHLDAAGFVLNFDTSKSLRAIVEDLIAQGRMLQSERRGTTYVGAMLQHMVGAKLELALKKSLQHHGSSVADAVSQRDGDFALDDVVIHVTIAPSEGLFQKCKINLQESKRPIIVTTSEGVAGAASLAQVAGISDRVDIVDAGQFIAMNLYELSAFAADKRRMTVDAFVRRYNEIVAKNESDPALKIAAKE